MRFIVGSQLGTASYGDGYKYVAGRMGVVLLFDVIIKDVAVVVRGFE